MKKGILIASAILLIFGSCSKQAVLPFEDYPIIGQWEGVKLVQKVNATVNYCDSYSVSFTFAPDGTGLYYGLKMNWRLDMGGPDDPGKITIFINRNPFFTATIQTNESDSQEWIIMESNSVYDLIKTSFQLTKKGSAIPDVPHGG